MNTNKILKLYAKRWRIDAFYRDAKQNLGFEDYEMRKLEGVRRHLSMVFIAHTLLVLGSDVVSKIAAAVDNKKNDSTSTTTVAAPKQSSKISNVVAGKAGACLS
jgi:SRSO17 transposase